MFSWDARKVVSNLKKHGVSFEEAATVFEDPAAIEWDDQEHSDLEPRYKCLGLSLANKILFVAYTPRRLSDGKEIIRIISARHASKKERQMYSR